MAACIVLWVGGVNVGLTALGFNVVGMILGGIPVIETWFNILVGASAVYILVTHKSDCKTCGS